MKRSILFLFVCVTLSVNAQMDNLSNLSVEWMRTGARNAATDAADIAVYNPAGLTSLNKGVHINFSNQSLFRSPSHSYDLGFGEGQKTFTQKSADPFLPELFITYNTKRLSVFGSIYNSGGGATMDYPGGSITTDLIGMSAVIASEGAYGQAINQHLKASSLYLTYQAGAAFAVSDRISASAAVRHISAVNKVEGGMSLSTSPFGLPDMPLGINYDETANGLGLAFGVNIKCSDALNISARYESQVNLNFKTETTKDDFGVSADGAKNRRDLPAVAALGVAFKMNSKIKMVADFNYYFQENADWGKTMLTKEESLSSLAGNACGTGVGFEYSITPKFSASIGGGYTKYMYNDKAGYYTHLGTFEVVQDDNTNINTGFAFKLSDRFKFNIAYMHTFWKDNDIKALLAQPLDINVRVKNSMNAFGAGVEVAF